MRFPLLLALLGTSLAAVAGPPGYHAPRRFLTPSRQPYHRDPLRISGGVNVAYYNGDLTSKLSHNTLRVGVNVGLTKTLSPHLTFVSDLSYLHLKAVDDYPDRGYSFSADNSLLTGRLQYNLFADKSLYIGPTHKEMPVLVFVEAGVGATIFNPSAAQHGVPLPPEGRNTYPALAAVLPVGGGVTLRASKRLAFTVEALYYFSSTDLLDDISQRGNPDKLDDFGTLTFKVEFSLGKSQKKPLVHNN
ncbi:hypothetical protein GKZ68_15100 [Hymenobacter sp. BRD128]|uniref:hypothetical protein n=1 Tax=Hymenobacter sp. BRD128 TaxID=2675878 RepID=UPI0015662113|nr:hypothetical protein [Hymenobacter sp. BRD128]QKG57836.1 hypothetical protein GKZ68_15100 [Hymenobacter sp. BRD128]